MGRFLKIFLCLVLCCALVLPASADQVTKYQSTTAVSAEGACQVSIYVTLQLDEVPEELKFPLPQNARDVTLNGESVSAKRSGSVREVDLLRRNIGTVPGEYSLNFQYAVSDTVAWNEDQVLMLTLPLMSGFGYSVSAMEFTITLPGEITSRPTFSSGYFHESIESYLKFTTSGSTISGYITAALKDHETLTMSLELDPEMFPSIRYRAESDLLFSDIGAIVCAVLALGYWLLTLRCLPVFGRRHPTPPEGSTAGDLGSRLTMVPMDLTMLVLTWAQLGYILIQMDDNGRVLLHKRMTMGNERSALENRVFKKLFPRKKYMIDGTGYHYARLCRYAAKLPAKTQGMFRRGSGNPVLFRILSAGVGFFGGISVAIHFTDSGVLGTGLAVVLSICGALSAWQIQGTMHRLHLQKSMSGKVTLVLCALWLILGAWSGADLMGICLVLSQLAAGLAAAYGGRRSELGRQNMQEVLGLRRYLKNVSREELERIQTYNPDYFYEMLPFAIALGVEKPFARRFGGRPQPDCTYLVTRMSSATTAWEWAALFRDVVEALDERQKQLPLERILGK